MMLFTAATFTILFIVLTLFPMLADESGGKTMVRKVLFIEYPVHA